jgi:scyllo-inositol 2-dehydrogenase (NADP+)
MRVGLIGYGLAGKVFHAPLLQGAGFQVAAIASRSLERRGQAHRDFPLATILSSAEELVAEDLDLVVVASTNQVHVEHARLAIDAGIPVVVDKPMALDKYQTEELFNYASLRSVPITVFFNRIWDSDTLTIAELIKSGEIGEIFRHESRFERFRPDANPQSWREQLPITEGGGLLLDLQTHLVSIALHLFGPADLHFASLRNIRGNSDDDVVLVLGHSSGVDSYLSVSAISGAPGPRLRLSGSKASLIARELDPQEDLLRSGNRPTETGWLESAAVTSEFRIHKGGDSFAYQGRPGNYVEFYRLVKEAIATSSAMPISSEFAIEVARILDQARMLDIHRL